MFNVLRSMSSVRSFRFGPRVIEKQNKTKRSNLPSVIRYMSTKDTTWVRRSALKESRSGHKRSLKSDKNVVQRMSPGSFCTQILIVMVF